MIERGSQFNTKGCNMPSGSDPAFPVGSGNTGYLGSVGLTKREWFAGMAMQGLLANPSAFADRNIVEQSRGLADALLAELAK
jgi:hypothetical protein